MNQKVLNFIEDKKSFDTFQEIAIALKIDRETVSRHIKDERFLTIRLPNGNRLPNPKSRIYLYKGTYYWGSPQEQVDAYIDWNNFKKYLDDPDVFKAIWKCTLKEIEKDLEKPDHQFERIKGTVMIQGPPPEEKPSAEDLEKSEKWVKELEEKFPIRN